MFFLKICYFINTKMFQKLISILIINEMLFEIQDVIPVEKERKKKHMPELFH